MGQVKAISRTTPAQAAGYLHDDFERDLERLRALLEVVTQPRLVEVQDEVLLRMARDLADDCDTTVRLGTFAKAGAELHMGVDAEVRTKTSQIHAVLICTTSERTDLSTLQQSAMHVLALELVDACKEIAAGSVLTPMGATK